MTATSIGLNGPVMFLGAYVKSVNMSLGLSTSPSNVSVVLHDDPPNGVFFQEPEVGKYYTLEIGDNFSFGGIITRFERDVRLISGRAIRVTINDPRYIMSYIPVITSPTSPNIYSQINQTKCSVIDVFNAFYVGDGSVNLSGWSEAGIPYSNFAASLKGANIRYGETLVSINAQAGKAYGESYRFNLDEITSIADPDYRINASLNPISNVIEELSALNSFDWFIDSERAADGVIDVTVRVVDRSTDSNTLALPEFLADYPDKVVSATSGVELRNDPSLFVLFGAPVEQIKKVDIVGLANEPIDLASESGSHAYVMNETEMRAVINGQHAWAMWVSIPEERGGGGGFSRYGGLLKDNQLVPVVPIEALEDIKLGNFVKNPARTYDYLLSNDFVVAGRVYEKLKSHAETSYGKRFVYADVYDEIIDSCWTRGARAGNDDPYEYFQQEDGRTRGFVEFIAAEGTSSGVISVFSTPEAEFGSNAAFRSTSTFGKTFSRQLVISSNTAASDTITVNIGAFGAVEDPNSLIALGCVLPLELSTLDLDNSAINMEKSQYIWNNSANPLPAPRTNLYAACTIDKDGVVRIESPIMEAKPSAQELIQMLIGASAAAAAADAADAAEGAAERQAAKDRELARIQRTMDAVLENIRLLQEYIDANEDFDYKIDAARRESLILNGRIARLQFQLNNAAARDVNAAAADEPDADGRSLAISDRIIQLAASIIGFGALELSSRAYQPRYVYIPTRSRYLRYGPVFPTTMNSETEGKLVVSNDDGFCPWEFGSIGLMQQAMQLKVDNSISNQKEVFSGQIEVEGYPRLSLGDSLDRNANINNISVSFDTNGVTTTYQLQTFTRKFGEFSKEDWARLALLANNAQFRSTPHRLSSFLHNHNVRVSKNSTGRGGAGPSPTLGGARNFG